MSSVGTRDKAGRRTPGALGHRRQVVAMALRHKSRALRETLLPYSLRENAEPLQASKDLSQQKHIITGQPGIGKSVFGWYLLYRLISEQPDRAILYVSYNERHSYMVMGCSGRVFRTHSSAFWLLTAWACDKELDPVLVADSVIPAEQHMPTVVIGSPGRVYARETKDRLNSYGPRWYMPRTSCEEVLELARVAFAHLSEEGVRTRMALWGPNPRMVLVKSSYNFQYHAWHELIMLSDRDLMTILLECTTGTADQTSHRILHQCARGEIMSDDNSALPLRIDSERFYFVGPRAFASNAIMRWVLGRAAGVAAFQLRLILDSTARVAKLGAAQGMCFEQLALEVLRAGGTFEQQKLDGSECKVVTIHAHAELRRFGDDEGLQAAAASRMLLVPLTKNYGAIDALLWDQGRECFVACNCTIARRHVIHGPFLARALRALGWTPEGGLPKLGSNSAGSAHVHFYWIVPDDMREEEDAFIDRPQLVSPPFSDADVKLNHELHQYVLRVPTTATLAIARRVATEVCPNATALLNVLDGLE